MKSLTKHHLTRKSHPVLCLALSILTTFTIATACYAADTYYTYQMAPITGNGGGVNTTDITKWNTKSFLSTDVILDPYKMGLNKAEATYLDKNGAAYANQSNSVFDMTEYKYKDGSDMSINNSTYVDTEAGQVCHVIRYKNSVSTNSEFGISDKIRLKFPGAAASIYGDTYDVYMTISGGESDNYKIMVKTSKENGNREKGIPLVWGCDSAMKFGAFPYKYDDHGIHGVKYHITIQLYKAGLEYGVEKNRIEQTGRSMLWGFDDIDIKDKFVGSGSYNSKDHQWAEHVTLYNTYISTDWKRFYAPLYVSNPTDLATVQSPGQSPGEQHPDKRNVTIYNKTTIDREDGTADVIFRINPYDFQYTWQGSECGTTAVAVGATVYEGKIGMYEGTAISESKRLGNGAYRTIHGNTQSIRFNHTITRNKVGTAADDETYLVESSESGGGLSTKVSSFAVGETKKVHDKTLSISLAPGQTKDVWQRLKFQVSDINDTLVAGARNGAGVRLNCSYLSGNGALGTSCVRLHRPEATFAAEVRGFVSSDNGSSYTRSSKYGNLITSSDGKFKIKFEGSLWRTDKEDSTHKNGAGGTVETSYAHVIKIGGIEAGSQNDYAGSRYPTSGTKKTKALKDGSSTDASAKTEIMFVNGGKNVYEGQIEHGEQITICGKISFSKTVTYDNTEGKVVYKSGQAYECVTVYRDSKTCDIDSNYSYSSYSGENLGSVGVINGTYNQYSNTGISYTPLAPSSFTNGNSKTVSTTIYARPGDSVRFYHKICAGGAYAVNANNITDDSKATTYTATATSPNGSYLFGKTVGEPIADTDPLVFSNPKTWSSKDSTFPYDTVFSSPSEPDGTDGDDEYDDSTYNAGTYKCGRLRSDVMDFYYEIAGGDDYQCNAAKRTGVASDVGKTITHTLVWDHVKATGGSETGAPTITNDGKYTAKANIEVPYNYTIQSTIASNSATHVVYLGETASFDTNIYVLPRANSAFNKDTDYATYATITKPTTVTLNYYYKYKNGGSSSKKQVTDTSGNPMGDTGILLNNKGNLNGTAEVNNATSYSNGGHHYKPFNVYVSDSLSVGDQVCAEIVVWPADSHDAPTQNVYGAKVNYSDPDTKKPALTTYASTSNTITRYACYTVAKKPTMSVEASNAYSGGSRGFTTARYARSFDSDSGTKYMFGSWTEYGVYGRVQVSSNRGMASGATFGYATGKNTNSIAVNATRNNNDSEKLATTSNVDSYCTFSTQTLANSNCKNSTSQIGMFNKTDNQSAEEFRSRTYSRFARTTIDDNTPQENKGNNRYGTDCTTSWSVELPDDKRCLKTTDGTKYANVSFFMNKTFDNNGVNHTHIVGNAYLGATRAFLTLWASHNIGNTQEYTIDGQTFEDRNFTRVIQVDGTLIIDADIKIGLYKSKTDTDDNPDLHNAGEVVQLIIIANQVKITSRVKQLDALIIADSIDTCAYQIDLAAGINTFSNSKKLVIGKANSSNEVAITASTCDNQLLFRAPVSTKEITLNRTYGAGSSTSSAQRAEIFSLNPYTYLWGFGQMSRYSQAVTTYSRELPARY